MADLRDQLRLRQQKVAAKADLRDLINLVDAYDLFRIGIIDHYAAMGNSLPYCQQLGNLAKELAKQLRLEVIDDRKGELLFPALSRGASCLVLSANFKVYRPLLHCTLSFITRNQGKNKAPTPEIRNGCVVEFKFSWRLEVSAEALHAAVTTAAFETAFLH